ncbi:MAG TPA: SBBP repeat-containing protein [Parafilimonas sp.]|nr:SBBP repeat-containing protein [Parafilimonas sp.]
MKNALLLTLIIFIFLNVKSQNLQFIENKGQWNSLVKYKANINSGSLFIEKDGYRVLLNNAAELKTIAEVLSGHAKSNKDSYILHSHAYEVKFENASANREVELADVLPGYNNYLIGKEPSGWALGCSAHGSITYRNIYKGVDIRYYAENGNFKYDFTVHPGADVQNIKLQFKGVDKLSAINQNLVIHTSVGELSELKPYTYQVKNNIKSAVNTAFNISGNTVTFKPGSYDKTIDLVIDPTLIFSSYVGSTADDWGYCSAYDAQGNFYSGSTVFDSGFPVSLGAFQTTFHGGDGSEGAGIGTDIGIFKFSADGTQRLYATYLGGTGNEQPQSMTVDKSGNLIISGRTTSADFPVTTSTYGNGGGFDIYITKLNADGSGLAGSRKFGGAGIDGVNIAPKYVTQGAISIRRNYDDDSRADIMIGDNDTIYFAGCTQSSDFPTTANAFKKTLSGMQDGVFIKASANLATVYTSSFFGGNNNDAIFSIARNKITGAIYLAGSTSSTDIALNAENNTQGIIHSSFSGGQCDGFVSMLSKDGNNLSRTVYVGTTGNDMLYEICADNVGNPYVMGTTTVTFPVINAVWKQEGSKQFITKLSSDILDIEYSTNFGKNISNPDVVPVAFSVDKCGNVYVAGWGGSANHEYVPGSSVNGLSTTPDALFTTTDGNDFYIFVLAANAASQLYGSFFGTQNPNALGDHLDGASSRFDDNGNLYLATCANCNKIGIFPTTTGVWSPGNQAQTGALCNFAGVKINFSYAGCSLPLTLVNFDVSYQNNSAIINWQTTNEVNVEKFVVEESDNAVNFSGIANIPARGNNAKTTSYSYIQSNLTPGIYYYRLKMLDKDGTYTYSKIERLITGDNEKPYLFVSPNPSNDKTTVFFRKLSTTATMVIMNAKGRVVKQQNIQAGKDQLTVNVQTLAAGIYYFVLITDNKRYKAAFIKN